MRPGQGTGNGLSPRNDVPPPPSPPPRPKLIGNPSKSDAGPYTGASAIVLTARLGSQSCESNRMRSRAQRSIKSFSESVHPSRIGLASSSQACAKEYTREVSRRENGRREPAYDPAEDGETYLRCRTTACRRTGPSSCPRRRSPRRRRGRLLRGLGAPKIGPAVSSVD